MTEPAITAPSSSSGVLGTITKVLNGILSAAGQPLTQKFVAHILTVVLSGTALALLPLGIATELNALIVIVAGLGAHYIAPHS